MRWMFFSASGLNRDGVKGLRVSGSRLSSLAGISGVTRSEL